MTWTPLAKQRKILEYPARVGNTLLSELQMVGGLACQVR